MQDSLPAAGPALPGGIGYPQGSCERFYGCNDSPFPSFLARCQSIFSRERVPCLGAGEIAKEHIPFAVGAEDIGSVVPAVDRVVNKAIACRSWKSSRESNLPT